MPATATDRLYGLTTSVAVKPPVQISADVNVTLFGPQTITTETQSGSHTLTTTEGDRILLTNQTSSLDNGIWLSRTATWVRAPDFDGPRDVVNGTMLFSIYGDCWRVEAADPVIIGDSAITLVPVAFNDETEAYFKRALRVPEESVDLLPPVSGRANMLLAFNSEGQPVVVEPESGSAADVLLDLASTEDGKGDALVAVKSVLTGGVARTQHDKNADIVSSADVGVTSDDSTTQFTNLDSEGVSALITADEISITTDIPGTVHLSLKEVTQSGAGALPIRNLSRKNILPKINTAYDVSDDSYYLKTPDKNLLANGAFTSWPGGFLTSVASAGQGYITTGWRLESAGGGPTAADVSQLSSWGGLSFSMTNGGSTTDYGYMYIRQYINGVQQFSGATLTTCIDIEVDQPVYLQAYVRMRINASNAAADRPIVADSNFIALDSTRKRIALTMVCPDVDSFRGTETDLNGLEFAWRVVDQRLGGTATTNVKVRGISLVPGDEIPSALSPQLYEDVVEANVMIENGTYSIVGLSSTAGQRRFWVPFRATKYRTPTITLTDVAGASGSVSTYDISGTRTDGVTPASITADGTGFEVLLSSSSAAGIKFTYRANSYW